MIKKSYDAAFKAKVAIEAIKEQRTISEIASDYKVHPNQVGKWRKQALEELGDIFSKPYIHNVGEHVGHHPVLV